MSCQCKIKNYNRIETFPNFSFLKIEMFDCIKKYVQQQNIPISDLSLANIFMWNHYYNFKISILNNLLIILSENSHQQNFYYPPIGTGDITGTIEKILDKSSELPYFQNQKPLFRRVYQTIVDKFLNISVLFRIL